MGYKRVDCIMKYNDAGWNLTNLPQLHWAGPGVGTYYFPWQRVRARAIMTGCRGPRLVCHAICGEGHKGGTADCVLPAKFGTISNSGELS
jgi:hypothetical protein